MISTIIFFLSLAGLAALVGLRAHELRTGTRKFHFFWESKRDRVLAENILAAKDLVFGLLKEGLRGLIILLLDGAEFLGREVGKIWQRETERLSNFMRERKLQSNGTMSLFLRDVIEHKQSLRDRRIY